VSPPLLLRYGSWGEPCACILWYREERRRKTRDIYRRHQPLQQSPCIRSVTYLRHKYTCNNSQHSVYKGNTFSHRYLLHFCSLLYEGNHFCMIENSSTFAKLLLSSLWAKCVPAPYHRRCMDDAYGSLQRSLGDGGAF